MTEVVGRGCCPQCGAHLPLGRGGTTVVCSYCGLTSSYSTVIAPSSASRSDALANAVVAPLYASRDALLVGFTPEALEARDPSRGGRAWVAKVPRTEQSLVTSFERIYLATDHALVAVDSASGRIAFVAHLPGPVSEVQGMPCVADISGPAQAHARVFVHVRDELVALDRMSGAIAERWPMHAPRCWTPGAGSLVAAAGSDAWLVDGARPAARFSVNGEVGATIVGMHAFLATPSAQLAIELADRSITWTASARWDPATGLRAAFLGELFVASDSTITSLPTNARVVMPGLVRELRMIAGTIVATAGSQLVAYQRSLAPAWQLELRDFEDVRIADNGRMLVVATARDDQLWVRGLLPSTGAPRWNVLVAGASSLVRHAVVGEHAIIDTEQHRYIVRVDSGQIASAIHRV